MKNFVCGKLEQRQQNKLRPWGQLTYSEKDQHLRIHYTTQVYIEFDWIEWDHLVAIVKEGYILINPFRMFVSPSISISE